MSRAREVMVAIDQLCNAVLGGYAQETVSSRCWRLRDYRPYSTMRRVIDAAFFWQVDHCRGSYESQVQRRNMPADYSNLPPAA